MLGHTDLEEVIAVSNTMRSTAMPQQRNHTPVTWIAFPTKNRPSVLWRAVHSYIANASQFGHQPALFIADDSDGSLAAFYHRLAVSATASAGPVQVFYAGRRERIAFCAALAEGGHIPRDVIYFALVGEVSGLGCIGANRNAILLQTLGSLVLSVDDDTVCDPAAVPCSNDETLKLGCHGEFGEYWFFKDRGSARGFGAKWNVDVIAGHERFLGKSLPQAGSENSRKSGAIDTHEACIHLRDDIQSDETKVCLTLNGVAGDSGTRDSEWVPMCTDHATRCRLADPATYRRARVSREIIRQCCATTISHTVPMVSTFLGIDNRLAMPPFPPCFRNEDAVFGQILAQTGQRYAVHLPWTLVHAPRGRRRYATAQVCSLRVSDILRMFLAVDTLAHPASLKQGLELMGRRIQALCRTTQADFDALLLDLSCARARNLESQTRVSLKALPFSGHSQWAEDLSKQIDLLQQFLTAPYLRSPIDARSWQDADDGRKVRRFIRNFGRLLQWWPSILCRTRELAAGGRYLARRII